MTKSFRRPAMLSPAVAAAIPGDIDPATRSEAAHLTAASLVHGARAHRQPEVVQRLVNLVAEQGLDTVTELWSSATADTLPGALYRLYLLQQWTIREAHSASDWYHQGMAAAPVASAVVGVCEPPSPDQLRALVDEVLSGFFVGDLAGALDRAAAYTRVLATGIAFDADTRDLTDQALGTMMTTSAASFAKVSRELTEAAKLQRENALE